MLGKFDSYRDSALHFLCSSEWSNESFGDVSTYGVYVSRISNAADDVSTFNTEVNSMLEEWEAANPEMLGTLECTLEEFRTSLVGHFMVSEDSAGFVHVKKYSLESELIRRFNDMRDHFDEWMSANSEDGENDNDNVY